MIDREPTYILGAEYFGRAKIENGFLDIGGVKVPYLEDASNPDKACVYVRRFSTDLSVAEICIARHDGLSEEESNRQNDEADRYPLGHEEYWRGEMVGKSSWRDTDDDEYRPMTNDDFEEFTHQEHAPWDYKCEYWRNKYPHGPDGDIEDVDAYSKLAD